MAAGRYDFTIEQGTTVDFTIAYNDATGAPINLTNYQAMMQLRPDYADNTTTKYLTLSSSLDADGTGLIITPTSGSIRIYISAAKSDTLTFDSSIYDLEIHSGSFVARLMEGTVKIRKSVTR
jgi:hypothetical protein